MPRLLTALFLVLAAALLLFAGYQAGAVRGQADTDARWRALLEEMRDRARSGNRAAQRACDSLDAYRRERDVQFPYYVPRVLGECP